MKDDSFEPPDFNGCSRECGRIAWAAELEAIDDCGGDNMEGRMNPPEADDESIDTESTMGWCSCIVVIVVMRLGSDVTARYYAL